MTQPFKKYDLTSIEFKRDPFPTFSQLLADGSVIRSRMPIMGKCWFVTPYDAVSELLRDQKRFVRDAKNAGRQFAAGIQWWMPKRLTRLANNMLVKDGEQHRRLRSLVDQAFQRRSVEQMQPRMELTGLSLRGLG
jgi:cytochrome P450